MNVVYVAGPYTAPDPAVNVRRAIDAAQSLAEAGMAPVVPHLTHFWHIVYPGEYEQWMGIDLALLARCDVVVRLAGASPGADREEDEAGQLGIPVVHVDDPAQAGPAVESHVAAAERATP